MQDLPQQIRRQEDVEDVSTSEACLPDETTMLILGEPVMYCRRCETLFPKWYNASIGYNMGLGYSGQRQAQIVICSKNIEVSEYGYKQTCRFGKNEEYHGPLYDLIHRGEMQVPGVREVRVPTGDHAGRNGRNRSTIQGYGGLYYK